MNRARDEAAKNQVEAQLDVDRSSHVDFFRSRTNFHTIGRTRIEAQTIGDSAWTDAASFFRVFSGLDQTLADHNPGCLRVGTFVKPQARRARKKTLVTGWQKEIITNSRSQA